MSATVHLYVPNNEVRWIAGPYWNTKPSEITYDLQNKSTIIYNDICDEAINKYGEEDTPEKLLFIEQESFERDPLDYGHWSDWKEHDYLTISKYNRKTMRTRNKRFSKYMTKIKELFPDYIRQDRGKYNTEKYIVVDEIGYRQGWWFNKQLFNCEESIFMAFTKADAIRLMNRFFNKVHNQDGSEAYEYFMELIEKQEDDRFIFEIAW